MPGPAGTSSTSPPINQQQSLPNVNRQPPTTGTSGSQPATATGTTGAQPAPRTGGQSGSATATSSTQPQPRGTAGTTGTTARNPKDPNATGSRNALPATASTLPLAIAIALGMFVAAGAVRMYRLKMTA